MRVLPWADAFVTISKNPQDKKEKVPINVVSKNCFHFPDSKRYSENWAVLSSLVYDLESKLNNSGPLAESRTFSKCKPCYTRQRNAA